MMRAMTLRRSLAALVVALPVASFAAGGCVPHANDGARSPVDLRAEARFDLRAVAVFEGLADTTGGKAFKLVRVDEKGLNEVIDAIAGTFSMLDVVFVVDTTHSMKTKLAELRSSTGGMLDHFWSKSKEGRIAVVAYRDIGEVYTSRIVTDFSDRKMHVSAALRGLQADGGGDIAEHAYSALMLAAKDLTWRPEARKAVIVFSDAPPHDGHADGATRDEFVELARSSSLSVFPITLASYLTGAPSGSEEKLGTVHVEDHGKPHGDDHGHGHGDFELVDYDEKTLEDLSGVARDGGGALYLAPCAEEIPGIIRGAMHSALLRSGGGPTDIVVVLDTTDSMYTATVGTRLGVESALNDFLDKHADVRVGLVLYRDKEDDYVTRIEEELGADLDDVMDAFFDVTTGGGGDVPEALAEALETTATMKWRDGARKSVIVVSDAPSHGGPSRDKAVETLRAKDVSIDAMVVGFNPYDGPFEDEGGMGSIDPEYIDDDPTDVDDLDTVVDLFPDGDVFEPASMSDFRYDMEDIFVEMRESAPSATAVEVAFVVDTTGSMGAALDGLARSHDAVHEFLEEGGRIGLVAFKDKGDEYVARKELDFTSDPHDLLRAFGKIDPYGGGDLPEAIYTGLHEATRLSWTPGSKRYMVLVTDDVAHRYEDDKKAITSWAKSSKATLFAFTTHFGYGDDDVDDYELPTAEYSIEAVGKLFDAPTTKVTDGPGFDDAIVEILDATVGGLKKKEVLEVAFLVDTTGSMGGALDHLTRNRSWYEKVLEPKTKHRIGLVLYKDEDDEYVTKVATKLTSSVDELMTAMKDRLEASGGGDLPEALLTGMRVTTELDWGKKTKKVIIVITDADSHDDVESREAATEWVKKNAATVHIVHADFWE